MTTWGLSTPPQGSILAHSGPQTLLQDVSHGRPLQCSVNPCVGHVGVHVFVCACVHSCWPHTDPTAVPQLAWDLGKRMRLMPQRSLGVAAGGDSLSLRAGQVTGP